LIGAIAIYRQEVRPFTNKQIELVTNFAAQAVIAIENTRLLNELRQRTDDLSESLEQQTATSEVLKVISGSPSELKPVFDAILENATRICEAKFGTMWLREGDAIRVVALHNAPPAYEKRRRNRLIHLVDLHSKSAFARFLKTRQVTHIADIRVDQGYLDGAPTTIDVADAAGARTVLMVPMLKDNELVGSITIYRQEVRPFTDKQIELVKNFASQAVIAIENARLLNELRESLQQQTATADVLKVISSSPGDLEPVFRAMLEKATQICGAKFGVMFRFADGAFRAVSWLGSPPAYTIEQPHIVSEHPHNPLTRIVSTKKPVHISDLTKERAYIEDNPRIVALVETAGARSLLVVPMVKNEELIGAIAVYWQEARSFTEKQIELISNFAAQAVIAIDNTRLLSELRESLQQQTATADVLKVISRSTFDLQTVLDTLVESVARLCEAEMASINREKGAAYQRVASYGYSPELQAYMDRHPIPAGQGSVVGRTVMEGGVIHIHDVLADPDYKMAEAAKLGGIRTMLGVPLLREGTSIGVLVLQRKGVRPFTDKQIELATTFADQAVIAIENARLLSELRQRTTDLSKSLEDLRTTQDRLVQTQKLASLGQLTAGIAHEIKNPLNFVNNFSGVSAELID
ncbi:MAG: GAF domain-containing protein, partial [Pseudolabrys sp.]